MRFERLDLNLLIVLDALLRDRSVSLAAERVHLSQPATSSALSRLRTFFEDDLLVMRGRGMVLTPRAEELIQPVAAVLAQIRETIATPKKFDPASSDRKLTIMTSDYSVEVLVAPTLRVIADEAPGMTFQILSIAEDPRELLARGLMDIAITTDSVISTEHPSELLFTDDFVVIGWSGNTALQQPMTRELYSSLGHVATRFGPAQNPTFEEFVLRHGAIYRRVEVVAPTFVSAASLIYGSRRIGTMHRRLAERLQRQHELVIFEAPFEIPPIRLSAQWLSGSTRDPALKWLVARLKQQATMEFGAKVPVI